jgi:hypothetical protein
LAHNILYILNSKVHFFVRKLRKLRNLGKMSKRRNDDEDYEPQRSIEEGKKIKKSQKKVVRKSNNTNTFLDENAKQIINLHKGGSKPKEIAASLCSAKSLKQGSITGKQISSWIDYRKKSGQLKTNSVSLDNKNLRVDFDDDCMIYFKIYRYH